MPVPGGLSSLSTVAASNFPDGSTELPSVLDNYQRTHWALFKRYVSGSPASISATLTLAWPDDYGYVEIAGSGEILDIADTFTWPGWRGVARFAGATTLSHSTNFALPGQAQIVTAAGDMAFFVRTLAGNYECVSYERRGTTNPEAGVFTTLDVHGAASFSATLVAREIIATSFSGVAVQLLQVLTASNSAALDTSSLTGYSIYKLELQDVLAATDAAALRMRVSSDGGSSFTVGQVYAYAWTGVLHGTGAVTGSSLSDTAVQLSSDSDNAVGRYNGFVQMNSANANGARGVWELNTRNQSVNPFTLAGGFDISVANVNSLRIMFSSGNITSGVIRVYGIRG